MNTLDELTPRQVKAALDAGKIVLIDVRTPAEYMIEHIEGALLMPMAFFRPDCLPGQGEKRIVLHCGSGMRSGRCGAAALAAGVRPLAHMGGGMQAWKAAGLPYIGTDPATGAPRRMGAPTA